LRSKLQRLLYAVFSPYTYGVIASLEYLTFYIYVFVRVDVRRQNRGDKDFFCPYPLDASRGLLSSVLDWVAVVGAAIAEARQSTPQREMGWFNAYWLVALISAIG